jgi:hypothetical protein
MASMSQTAVRCPECDRGFVINGRGRCRCGAYLVHHTPRAYLTDHDDLLPPDGPATWLWVENEWVKLGDLLGLDAADLQAVARAGSIVAWDEVDFHGDDESKS